MRLQGRWIAVALLGGGALFLGISYLYMDLSNDWPRLYLSATNACSGKEQCTLDLAEVYGGDWESVVALDDGGEQGYKEGVVGKPLREYEEFHQGLVFLGKNGEVVAEKYSGAHFELLFGNPRPKLRLGFPEQQGYWKLNRPITFVCVNVMRRGGKAFYSVDPGKCIGEKT